MNLNQHGSHLIDESCNLLEDDSPKTSFGVESTKKFPSEAEVEGGQRTTVIVQYNPDLTAKIQFNKPGSHTSGWLFSTLMKRLRSQANDRLTQAKIRSIVAFKTAEKNLLRDVLLTIEDYPLTFLDQETILVPYFGSEPRYREDSLTPLVGLQDFEFTKHLGHGGFSRVLLARKRDTGKFYAVKQIKKNETIRQTVVVNNEKNMLLGLPEEFFSRLKFSFQTTDSYFFVMKFYIGGDLHHYFKRKRAIPEKNAKDIIVQLIAGLEILHAKNIIFRDLKPENLLIDEKGHIHYADLGFCKRMNPNEHFVKGVCGTVEFMAPEVLAETGYDHRADYYSLGVVLYEMLIGTPPFSRSKYKRKEIEFEILNTLPKIPDSLSLECRDLLTKLLIKDPAARLGGQKGIQEIKEHCWFKDIDFELVKQRKFPKSSREIPFGAWVRQTKLAEIPHDDRQGPKYIERLERFSCYNDDEDPSYSTQQSLCEKMSRFSLLSKEKHSLHLRNSSHTLEFSGLKSNPRMTTEQVLPSTRISSRRHTGERFHFSFRSEMEGSPIRRGCSNRNAKKNTSSKTIDHGAMDSTMDFDNELYISEDESAELLQESKKFYDFNKLVKITNIFSKP